jgi:hypothetical protein
MKREIWEKKKKKNEKKARLDRFDNEVLDNPKQQNGMNFEFA